MATEQLEQQTARICEANGKLAAQLAQLTEGDLARPTLYAWAPTVGQFLVALASHPRGHLQQVASKRKALGLEQTSAQAAQGELEGALIGLTDEDLESVPEGQNWPIG